jgi:galactokinase
MASGRIRRALPDGGAALDVHAIRQGFDDTFGHPPEAVYFSPGRVNLIGEHIDYNGGRVMPVAISAGTRFAVARNRTGLLDVHSSLFDERRSFALKSLADLRSTGHWTDYLVGMMQRLMQSCGDVPGVDMLVTSDLPQASGLSSSASFAVGFGFAISDLFGLNMDRLMLALTAQAVENDFVGVNCGIMDQFTVAMGRAGHCLVLDCDSLEYQSVPMRLDGHEIVIANTMVPRRLSESQYNQRRAECQQALELAQRHFPVRLLCQLSVAQVEACPELRASGTPYRRARHAASENGRVGEAVAALAAGRLERFGALMNASHDSLRDDYEVSCRELDVLVDTARAVRGVLGSRMTGAGFGGCTVSIVATDALAEFRAVLSETYARETAFQTRIHCAQPGDGARRLD